jgi:TonB family protein
MSERIHTQYTAEDIEKYLNGSLTPLQMNAMEKAALDDAFLAEAMEGYAGMQQNDWKNDLAGLKQNFAQQQEAKTISITKNKNNWRRAAAAVLIVVLTGSLGYYLLSKKTTVDIAGQDIKISTANNDTVKIAGTDTKEINTETAGATTNPVIAQNKIPEEHNTVVKDITHNYAYRQTVADSNFVYKPETVKTEPKAKQTLPAEAKEAEELKEVVTQNNAAVSPSGNAAVNTNNNNGYNSNTEFAKKSSNQYQNVFDKNAEKDNFIKDQQPALNKSFFAQVTSTDNTPLPFANISIKSENFGTYADVKGNFRLLSNDSVLTVEIRSAGFKPQLYNLKSTVSLNKIILTEDNSAMANATVVTASGARAKTSRRATLVKDSIVNVEPADGWDNYYTYADNNFDIPDDILQKNIHGQVELSFDVNPQGVISNIKVDKSLCNGCDEAAVRLLQQGPQWKVKKGKKGKGKITIRF